MLRTDFFQGEPVSTDIVKRGGRRDSDYTGSAGAPQCGEV